jgi:hypothetical protein
MVKVFICRLQLGYRELSFVHLYYISSYRSSR